MLRESALFVAGKQLLLRRRRWWWELSVLDAA
jgi:hypothetical protein